MKLWMTIAALPLFTVRILPRLFWYSLQRPALLKQIPDLFQAYVVYLMCRYRGMEF